MSPSEPRIPLPESWPIHVPAAILHVIALAQFATARDQQCQYTNSATIKMRPASREIAPQRAGHGIKGSRRRAH